MYHCLRFLSSRGGIVPLNFRFLVCGINVGGSGLGACLTNLMRPSSADTIGLCCWIYSRSTVVAKVPVKLAKLDNISIKYSFRVILPRQKDADV